MRREKLSHASHVRLFLGLLAIATPATAAFAAPRACLVSDVRYVTARQQMGVQLVCEGGRYRAGLLDEVSVYRGLIGQGDDLRDEITIIKREPAREGQIYRCVETVKTLPASWFCSLEP